MLVKFLLTDSDADGIIDDEISTPSSPEPETKKRRVSTERIPCVTSSQINATSAGGGFRPGRYSGIEILERIFQDRKR